MLSISISNRKKETDLLQRVFLCIFGCSWAGALSHTNDNSTFLEAHFIHQRFHQVDAASMNGSDVFGGGRIRDHVSVKSSPLVLYRDRDFIGFTAATNIDVFSRILMISVNDRVCEGFAQCDLNPALALRNTAALPEQEHEPIHEGRDRSHLAWQRAL